MDSVRSNCCKRIKVKESGFNLFNLYMDVIKGTRELLERSRVLRILGGIYGGKGLGEGFGHIRR